jgi:AcrR family transcriptional regulator
VTSAPSTRLPAAARRQAIVEAALRVFAGGSYRGGTTAGIAQEAGISEPILYRHFQSKRDLYFACLDEAWARLREAVEEVVADEPPSEWPMAVPKAVHALKERRLLPSHMWIQALAEAGHDDQIAAFLRGHLREVHDYFAALLRRAQEAGGVPPDRDPEAEAWIMLGIGLLRSVQDRLGGLLVEDEFAAIGASRRRWLAGQG